MMRFLKNKFLIVTLVFLVWIIFFAQYDLLSLYKQRSEYKELLNKIEYLEKEVKRLEQEKNDLKLNIETKERYAREKYYMKKPNEEVYVFDTVSSIPSYK